MVSSSGARNGGGTRSNRTGWARQSVGCLGLVIAFLAIAREIDRWAGPSLVPGARPWLGAVAGGVFTLAIAVFWGLVSRHTRGRNSRAAILRRAATGTLPDTDGLVLASGTVGAIGAPLQAPLSGVACVAYVYRMYYETLDRKRCVVEVPVYWGFAGRAFVMETPTTALPVMAVPQLADAAIRREGRQHVDRARAWVDATRFEEAQGMLGAVGTAFATVNALFSDEDGAHRRDWMRVGEPRDPSTLLLEETVLAVGAKASIVGPWSVARHAVVASSQAPGMLGVTVTTGPVETLLRADSQLPASVTRVLVHGLVLVAVGIGIVWGGMAIFGRGP